MAELNTSFPLPKFISLNGPMQVLERKKLKKNKYLNIFVLIIIKIILYVCV